MFSNGFADLDSSATPGVSSTMLAAGHHDVAVFQLSNFLATGQWRKIKEIARPVVLH